MKRWNSHEVKWETSVDPMNTMWRDEQYIIIIHDMVHYIIHDTIYYTRYNILYMMQYIMLHNLCIIYAWCNTLYMMQYIIHDAIYYTWYNILYMMQYIIQDAIYYRWCQVSNVQVALQHCWQSLEMCCICSCCAVLHNSPPVSRSPLTNNSKICL